MSDYLEEDGKLVEGKPYGWIQWKGTGVCIDLHCACGAHLHFDGDFMYHWICPHCGRHYESGSHVRMYEMTPEQVEAAERQGFEFEHPAEDEDWRAPETAA